MKEKKLVFFSIILMLIIIVCVFAPFITPIDPDVVDLLSIDQPPSVKHLLGTDALGRDNFSRLLYGGRISIAVGIIVATLQLFIGVGLGMMSGYYGGWIDIVMLKIAELIQCFPFFILTMALVSVVGSGFMSVILVLGTIGWPSIFFVIRAETLKLREEEFVLASRVLGASHHRILYKHILPHVTHLMWTQMTISVSAAILSESSLSFLGMGIMPPHSSWGNILTAARTISVLKHNWWQWLPAGISIFIVILSIMMIGGALNSRHAATYKE